MTEGRPVKSTPQGKGNAKVLGYIVGVTVACIVASVIAGVAYASTEKSEPTHRAPSEQVQRLLAGRSALEVGRMNLNHLTAKDKTCFFDYEPVLFQDYTESAGQQWLSVVTFIAVFLVSKLIADPISRRFFGSLDADKQIRCSDYILELVITTGECMHMKGPVPIIQHTAGSLVPSRPFSRLRFACCSPAGDPIDEQALGASVLP
jgi:hypothetical protein